MSNTLSKIKDIQSELSELEVRKDLAQAQKVILSVVRLLDDSISVNDSNLYQLFTDSDGKIRANHSWFYEDQTMTDRKATYKIYPENSLNIDFKLFGLTKPIKRTISWVQALTTNFEDESFNLKFNIGIDFVVPKSADKVIIILSNNWVIRTLELKGDLTATYQEILSKWADIKDFDNKKELHNILWESFDLQPLNKTFYVGISERFIELRQHLVKEKVLDEKHASMFANRLIGRVIFCWFLDKKGIINSDIKYFDSDQFDEDTKYYKTKLERLFFGILNTAVGDREYKDDITPFLNGGLFEARENDLRHDSRLTFPKNYFDDLFKFLSGYNFTTDESTSQFQQVAIDPEMLGRIFENLLAEMTEETGEQARKAKGAFYTPREIVDYMCKESLKEYLKAKIKEDEHRDQRLYQLIDAPDKDFQDQDHNWRRDWKPYKEGIIEALDELKVLDPACGSGAFPIGMMQLLVRVYERLEARFDPFKTKIEIIEKNIYGVDIEPMAVEIARLRTWLSIIVDEEADSKKIKPLPNLEFKFVCANSLIDLDQNGTSAFGDNPELENKLKEIRNAYFNTSSLNKKKKLRKNYDSLVIGTDSLFGESEKSRQLKTYRPFDNEWSTSFFNPEFMFGVKKFNITIGNPPWEKFKPLDPEFFGNYCVNYRELSKNKQKETREDLLRDDKISNAYKEYIQKYKEMGIYFKNSYSLQGSSDLNLYKLFLERSYSISNIVALLIPGQITIDQGGKIFREKLFSDRSIVTIVGLSNKDGLFPSIDNNQKFVIFILNNKNKNKNINIYGWISSLQNFRNLQLIQVKQDFFEEFDENKTIFLDTGKNTDIIKKFKSNNKLLTLNKLNYHYWRECDATNDSSYFNDIEGEYLLFSGKAIGQYDCMSKSWIEKHGRSSLWKDVGFPKTKEYRAEYFVNEIPSRILEHHKKDNSEYRIVVQTVTGAINNMRTLYSALLPKKHLTNNSLGNLFIGKNSEELVFYTAILNSFITDWQARLKVATNLNKFILDTLFVPEYSKVPEDIRKKIVKLAISLSSVSDDFECLTQDVLSESYKSILITRDTDRQEAKNKLDALVAKLFNLSKEDFQYILSTFPIVNNDIKIDILKKYNSKSYT